MASPLPQQLNAKTVPIDSLHQDMANARTHDAKNLQAIKDSLRQFSQVEALVVQKGTGKVIGGNGRLEAMRALGWTECAIVELDISDIRATALGIALNRTGELADWDKQTLETLLSTLHQDDAAWLPQMGFNPDDLDAYDIQVDGYTRGQPSPEEDVIPDAAPAPVTVDGDLWTLGPHRLVCGDATSPVVSQRLLDGRVPLMMVTVPPYGVELDLEWRGRAGANPLGANRTGKVSNDDRASWLDVWRTFTGDIAYVWHASAFSDVVMRDLRDAGFDVRQQIIWVKQVMALSRSAYHWKHEPCWYAVRRGATAHWTGDRTQVTTWDAASPNHIMGSSTDDHTDHPTQKPVSLMTKALGNHGAAGDAVYDPFAGSGTTIIAAEQLQRQCFAVEISPAYCDIIVERWQNLTGGKATRTSA